MAKKRFRDIKQGKVSTEISLEEKTSAGQLKRDYASKSTKVKAFLTDSFMLCLLYTSDAADE